MDELIPKSLRHLVKNYPILRKRLRLNILSGTTVSANGLSRVSLPQGCLLDMSTFEFSGDVAISGGANPYQTCPPSHCFLKRFNPIIGGVSTNATASNYNQLANGIWRASTGYDYSLSNVLARMAPDQNEPTAQAATFPNIGYTVWNWFPQTIMDANVVLDTSIVSGGSEIEILFDSVNVIQTNSVNNPNNTATDYTISNLRAFVDVLLVQDETYHRSVQNRLNVEGREVKVLCPSSMIAVQVNNGSNTWNVSTQSLDCVVALAKSSGYDTSTSCQLMAATNNTNAYMSFAAEFAAGQTAFNSSAYAQVNSELFPQYGSSTNCYELSEFTRNYWGKNSVYNFNGLYSAGTNKGATCFITDNHCVFIPIADKPANRANGFISGLDTRGSNSIISWRSNGYASTLSWVLAGLTSSMLVIQPGGACSFVM